MAGGKSGVREEESVKKSTGPSSTTDRRAAIARARVWLHCHGRRISGLLGAGLAVAPVAL